MPGVRGPRPEAGRRADRARARRDARPLRRRRAAALGGGQGRPLGPDRARVRDQHPRHGRRRGADERERVRRRAGGGPGVGHGLRAGRRRAPRRPTSSASSTGARTSSRARWSRARPSPSRRPSPKSVKATLAGMREKRREAQPSGIKTFGSTFKNPDDPRAEGLSAGMLLDAVGARGLEVGGARFSPKHANFVENTGDGDDGRHPRPDGRRPPARPRALRRRARARGPDPGRRRVARRTGTSARRPAGRRGRLARELKANGLISRFDSVGRRRSGQARGGAKASPRKRSRKRPQAPAQDEAGGQAKAPAEAEGRSRRRRPRPSRRPRARSRLAPRPPASPSLWSRGPSRSPSSSATITLGLAAAYFFWFRDSSFVAGREGDGRGHRGARGSGGDRCALARRPRR